MYYTNQRNHKTRKHNNITPLENIINEMMNIPIKRIANQKDIQFTFPATNIEELEDKFEIQLMLPGLSKKDINIKIDNHELIVSKETDSTTTEKKDYPSYKLREFNYSQFERKFKLPINVLTSSIKAALSKGILTITLTKDPDATRSIKVS